MPHIVSWAINHGNNNIEDFWMIHSTEAEARQQLETLIATEDNLWCWAISRPVEVSEPHWLEEGGA